MFPPNNKKNYFDFFYLLKMFSKYEIDTDFDPAIDENLGRLKQEPVSKIYNRRSVLIVADVIDPFVQPILQNIAESFFGDQELDILFEYTNSENIMIYVNRGQDYAGINDPINFETDLTIFYNDYNHTVIPDTFKVETQSSLLEDFYVYVDRCFAQILYSDYIVLRNNSNTKNARRHSSRMIF